MSAVSTGFTAGLDAWRAGPPESTWDALQARYAERYLLSSGELFMDAVRTNPYKNDPRVYKNLSLLWNHSSRVVDFYATLTYQGELKAVPGEGAIPVRPDPALQTEQVTNLMAALAVFYDKWNWQQQMVIRPKLGAALGDVLTELVDDADRRFVYPKVIWPGYVKAIELDYVGNVRAYTLEYQITEQHEQGRRETYTFRKEVDGDAFRYFKDDKPFDYYGDGAVVPNPYGFVPAVWDRHIVDGFSERGQAATDVSRQALFNLNSLFSHARDFQHKAFFAPVIVEGEITKQGQTSIDLSTPPTAQPSPSAMAETLKFLQAPKGGAVHQPVFDIGQTLAQLEFMRDGILATHPEATFFDKLADAANVTGPGADRIILPVKGLVEHARAGYDNNTVHLFQMAISMCGMRVNEGAWDYVPARTETGRMVKAPLTKSREAFRPYTLASYANEEMGFQIAARDIVPPSRAEIVDLTRSIEELQTRWGLQNVGIDETEAKQMLADRYQVIGDMAPADDDEAGVA